MNVIKRFLKFIEIETKVVSLMSFMTGISYCLYIYNDINILQSFILLISILSFDMATTAINNHIDRRVEKKEPHFSFKVSFTIILLLNMLSIILGIYLTSMHGLIILIIGVVCFATGILYSFSPLSISKTPYGEIFSGIMMGFFIIFLIIYINSPKGYLVDFNIISFDIYVYINSIEMLKIILFTIPTILCTSNIMLANNICDVNNDVIMKRYTLPYYIGIKNSLSLFFSLYLIAYLSIFIMLILSILPLSAFICFLTAIPTIKNINTFTKIQIKDKTFILSVVNFLSLTLSICVALIFSVIYNIEW